MPKFKQLKIADIRKETEETVSIAFEVPADLKEEYQFIAGQYLTLKAMINGEDVRRSYSICSAPHENELRVAIKKVQDGRFSTFANEVLTENDTLEVMPPMGKFQAIPNPSNKRNYLGFVGGSGITPVISIIKTVLTNEPQSTFTLFYGNRTVNSIIFKEEIEGLKNTYLNRFVLHHLLSNEKLEAPLFNGRMDQEKCRLLYKLIVDPKKMDDIYICGPKPMMDEIIASLEEEKVDMKKVHFELFTSPLGNLAKEKKPIISPFDAKKESMITIKLDGDEFDFRLKYGGNNILDAAMNTGADLPFACKGGVCATCKAKVIEGEVAMDVNYGLDPEEVEAGYILTCQAHPRTAKIVVDFDV